MIESTPFRCALKLAPALLAAALFSATATAGVTDGEAFGACKQKARATFGEQSTVKLKRIKARSGFIVDLKVTGSSEKAISATCKVERDGTVSSFEHDAAK